MRFCYGPSARRLEPMHRPLLPEDGLALQGQAGAGLPLSDFPVFAGRALVARRLERPVRWCRWLSLETGGYYLRGRLCGPISERLAVR